MLIEHRVERACETSVETVGAVEANDDGGIIYFQEVRILVRFLYGLQAGFCFDLCVHRFTSLLVLANAACIMRQSPL